MRQWVGYLLFAVVLYLHIVYLLRNDVEEVEKWTVSDHLPRLRYTSNCTMTTCLDVRRIGGTGRLRVWMQPVVEMRDEKGSLLTPIPSAEFMQLRSIIAASEWATVDEREATLVVPGVDFLNQDRFEGDSLRAVYDRLKEKYDRRMLIYSFHGRKLTEDTAVIANAQPVSSRFRRDFDVSLPVWRGDEWFEEETIGGKREAINPDSNHIGLLILQMDDVEKGLDNRIREVHAGLEKVLWIRRCAMGAEGDLCDENGREWSYEEALRASDFVLISDDLPSHSRILIDGLRAGAIPIILAPSFVLPFEEIIDWSRFSLSLLSLTHLKDAVEGLRKDEVRMEEMRRQGEMVYRKYFSRLSEIVISSLHLIEGRLVPHRQWTYERWNGDEEELPLDLPYLASEDTKAVAVVIGEEGEEVRIDMISGVKSLLFSKRIDRVIVVGREGRGEELISHWSLPSSLPDPSLSTMMRLLRDPSQVFVLLRSAAGDDDAAMMMHQQRIERGMMIWRTMPTSAIFLVNAEGRVQGVVVHKTVLDSSVRQSQQQQEEKEWSYDRLIERLAAAAAVKMVVVERDASGGTAELPSLPVSLSAVPRV